MADTQFSSDMSGVEIDPDDPLLLRAAIAGSPKLINQGVQVNPVVEVDAVDLTTGNINFEGSLQVRGDISATMEVRVTGDVVVNGTMEAALVEAGGNVTVKGGIIGMAEAMQDASGPARTAHIVCGGELKARFIENAIISAGQNVEVEREIRQCSIAAGGGQRGRRQRAADRHHGRPDPRPAGGARRHHRFARRRAHAGAGGPGPARRHQAHGVDAQAREDERGKGQARTAAAVPALHPERATGDVVDRARNTHAKLGRDRSRWKRKRPSWCATCSRSTQPASRPAGAIAAA